MLLAYHLFTEREDLYASGSSGGHDPRAVAFPLSEALPCIRSYSRWDAEANRRGRWKTNSYLEQLKTVERETQTSRWHSQMPLALMLPSQFFGSAVHFAPTLLSRWAECEGWSWGSCLFVLQEGEAAPFADPPPSLWGTPHPFNELLHGRAYSPHTRPDKRARKTKIGDKDKVTVKLS